MHIPETTHEHGVNAKVYTFEADYELVDGSVRWQADVRQGEMPVKRLSGDIVVSTPAAATIAEQVVHDAIVRAIDGLDAGDGTH